MSSKQVDIYRVKYGHIVDGKHARAISTKKEAMKKIRAGLKRFPDMKISLQQAKKNSAGWKPHSSYVKRRNRITGKVRIVKL